MARRRNGYDSDSAIVAELVLIATNDGRAYQQMGRHIIANLAKKMAKGTYNATQAVKLWQYYVDDAARRYDVDHGSGGHYPKSKTGRIDYSKKIGSLKIFPSAIRKAAAVEVEEHYREEVEYDARAIRPAAKRNGSSIDIGDTVQKAATPFFGTYTVVDVYSRADGTELAKIEDAEGRTATTYLSDLQKVSVRSITRAEAQAWHDAGLRVSGAHDLGRKRNSRLRR